MNLVVLSLSTGAIIGISVAAVIVLLIVIILAWYISIMNWFRKTKVKVEEAKSSIDASLTKRYDLLTKLLASVKQYQKHEAETLSKVISLRSSSINELSLKEKAELSTKMDDLEKGINVVVENYPELKADKVFLDLHAQSIKCEDELLATRRIYNSNVSTFNQRRVSFPDSIVAKRIGFKEDLEFFQVEEKKKEDVKFEF